MSLRNSFVKRLGLPAAVVLTLLAWGAVALGASYLDGRTFGVEIGEQGKTMGDPETLVFKDKRFDPLDCHKWGFAAAPYTTREQDGRVTFEAETKSEKEGIMRWQGAVQGDAISGTVVWSKPGQAPVEYWFKGTQRK